MKTYLLNLWDALRGSFWAVPALLGLGALVLGVGMPWLDQWLAAAGYEHYAFVQTTTDAARSTLSAVAGATTTMAATVFSITVVTLSLTSQQFGPRLLRTFMFDVPTQWTLGVFVSTSLYCLLVLPVVEDHGPNAAPHLSVELAVIMAVVSLAMLIVFIHHVSMLIQAPHVVKAVAIDLDSAIERLFPETIGHPHEANGANEPPDTRAWERRGRRRHEIQATQEGYIQAIDSDGLLSLARHHELVVRLQQRPGDFLRRGATLIVFWSERNLSEADLAHIGHETNETIIVGMRRTPRQDLECAVNELVEVAVRSLSPGINDPFTAMHCIDYLTASLCRLAGRKMPPGNRSDTEGRLRVIVERPTTFPDVLSTAIDRIRRYGRSHTEITLELLMALATIAGAAVRGEDRGAIRRLADIIREGGQQSLHAEIDRREVQVQYDRVLEALSR